MKNKRLPKVRISRDAAEQLEEAISDCVSADGNDFSNTHLRQLFKEFAVPKEVQRVIYIRGNNVKDMVEEMADGGGDCDRTFVEDLVDAYKSLDDFLQKTFVVTPEGRSKRPYTWRIE